MVKWIPDLPTQKIILIHAINYLEKKSEKNNDKTPLYHTFTNAMREAKKPLYDVFPIGQTIRFRFKHNGMRSLLIIHKQNCVIQIDYYLDLVKPLRTLFENNNLIWELEFD